jgi:hypothetical protein
VVGSSEDKDLPRVLVKTERPCGGFVSFPARDDSVPLDEEGWYPNPRPLGLVDTLPTWPLVSSAEAKARSTIILRPSPGESHADSVIGRPNAQ